MTAEQELAKIEREQSRADREVKQTEIRRPKKPVKSKAEKRIKDEDVEAPSLEESVEQVANASAKRKMSNKKEFLNHQTRENIRKASVQRKLKEERIRAAALAQKVAEDKRKRERECIQQQKAAEAKRQEDERNRRVAAQRKQAKQRRRDEQMKSKLTQLSKEVRSADSDFFRVSNGRSSSHVVAQVQHIHLVCTTKLLEFITDCRRMSNNKELQTRLHTEASGKYEKIQKQNDILKTLFQDAQRREAAEARARQEKTPRRDLMPHQSRPRQHNPKRRRSPSRPREDTRSDSVIAQILRDDEYRKLKQEQEDEALARQLQYLEDTEPGVWK